jgi:hypothetical protein
MVRGAGDRKWITRLGGRGTRGRARGARARLPAARGRGKRGLERSIARRRPWRPRAPRASPERSAQARNRPSRPVRAGGCCDHVTAARHAADSISFHSPPLGFLQFETSIVVCLTPGSIQGERRDPRPAKAESGRSRAGKTSSRDARCRRPRTCKAPQIHCPGDQQGATSADLRCRLRTSFLSPSRHSRAALLVRDEVRKVGARALSRRAMAGRVKRPRQPRGARATRGLRA